MNKKLIVVFVIVAAVLLYLFAGRKTAASSAPVAQPGAAAGGINFVSIDEATGLPVFDATANPAYVKGLAPDIGGTYSCGAGTTPALSASNGRVYCVIPAETGTFTAQAPVVAPVSSIPGFQAQGPTQAQLTSGTGSIQTVPYTPVSDALGTSASAGVVDPNLDTSPVFDTGGTDPTSVFFS